MYFKDHAYGKDKIFVQSDFFEEMTKLQYQKLFFIQIQKKISNPDSQSVSIVDLSAKKCIDFRHLLELDCAKNT